MRSKKDSTVSVVVLPKHLLIALGARVGESLMREMRFLGNLKEDDNLDELLDIPQRDKLRFQVIGGMDAAKSAGARGSFSADLAGLHFCVTSGDVAKAQMFDIDHTVPFKYIHDKQEALLEYLNKDENKDFSQGFLSASTILDGVAISIGQYFGRDATGIKGTRRFFRLCYNDIDNLLLLCHACNVAKGAQESLGWFRAQEPFLGIPFAKAVTDAGGLHDGIIVKKILRPSTGTEIRIGKYVCWIHNGDAKGLGAFVDEWFEITNRGYPDSVVSAYKHVWLKLKDIFQLQLGDKGSRKEKETARGASSKLTAALCAMIEQVELRYGLGVIFGTGGRSSSETSSSDDSTNRAARIIELMREIKQVFDYIHTVKQLQSAIAAKNPLFLDKDHKTKFKKELYELLESLGIPTQSDAVKENIFKAIFKKIDSYVGIPSAVMIEGIIKDALKENDPVTKLTATLAAERRMRGELTERNLRLAARITELEQKESARGGIAAEQAPSAIIAQPQALTSGSSVHLPLRESAADVAPGERWQSSTAVVTGKLRKRQRDVAGTMIAEEGVQESRPKRKLIALNSIIIIANDILKLFAQKILAKKSSWKTTAQLIENYGIEIRDCGAGGDCLFLAMATQVGRNLELGTNGDIGTDHLILRELAVAAIASQQGELGALLDEEMLITALNPVGQRVGSFDNYVTLMSRPGTWGGQVEILALARILSRPIVLLGNNISPQFFEEGAAGEPILLFYTGNHYQRVIPPLGTAVKDLFVQIQRDAATPVVTASQTHGSAHAARSAAIDAETASDVAMVSGRKLA